MAFWATVIEGPNIDPMVMMIWSYISFFKGIILEGSFLWNWEKSWVVFTGGLSIVISLINSQFFDSLSLFWLEPLQGNSVLEECLILWGLTVNIKSCVHVFQWLSRETIEDTAFISIVRIIRVRSFIVLFRRTIKKRRSPCHVWFLDFTLIPSPVISWNWASVEQLISWCSDLCRIIMRSSSFPANLLVVIEDRRKGVVHFFLLIK